MRKVVAIAEGDGEVDGLPRLIARILKEYENTSVIPGEVINAHGRGNITDIGKLAGFLRVAERKPGCAAILLLLDADKDCASRLAIGLARTVRSIGCKFPVAIVCAKCEYESWFLASLRSIAGVPIRGDSALPGGLAFEGNVEDLRDAKGWISKHLSGGRSYNPALDQARLSSLIDVQDTRSRSRSFRRLCDAIAELTHAVETGTVTFTPKVR